MANIFYALLAYLFMEFVAWFSHKYIMHGFLWSFHRDHHIATPQKASFFQKNDLFFIIYALPAMILIIAGFAFAVTPFLAIGAGISLYGLTYFLVHDVLIHRRIPVKIKITGGYFAALIRAHEAHHTGKNVKDFNNYGLLVFNPRYFRK